MRRGCRGSQDMPLPDWHAVAVHRARSSALPPRVCGCWSVRDRWGSQILKKAPVPRHLHSPKQPTRSADRIPRNSGKGWPVGRATRSVTACGHHAQGSKPSPWWRTICRPGIRIYGEPCPPGKTVIGWTVEGTLWLHRGSIAPAERIPPLCSRPTSNRFPTVCVLFMFSYDSKQGMRRAR